MAIRVALNHKTKYTFDRLVNLSPHVIMLRPAPHSRTPIHSYSLKITPEDHFINWMQDPFGNYQARLVFPEKTEEMSIEVDVIAEMTVINPFDFFVETYAENYPFKYKKELKEELAPYLVKEKAGKRLKKYLKTVDRSETTIQNFLVQINQNLEKEIGYNVRMEPGVQSCEKTLKKKTGSCRDTSWLLVQLARHLGLAARFVSGYLVQLSSDEESLDGPSGPAEDFTDLHAWCEIYIPGAGWVGLDPTSGLLAGEGHIPLACTPNPESAAPVTGGMDKCEVEFEHSNTVQRILEDPRVTKPYTERQWFNITELGKQVDAELEEGDVRLTMGGEPTFVSIDDMESEQWNTAALGDHKRELAGELLLRLHKRFADGGLLHYGQGKWYPGEELPRWALGTFWRVDGTPIWKDEDLIAKDGKDYGLTQKDGETFLADLMRFLGLPTKFKIPAFEDVLYFLWQEGKLSPEHEIEGLDLDKVDLADPLERQAITRLLNQDLNDPSGYVVPIQYNSGQDKWETGEWNFRQGKLMLSPGDSPIGLRLPLGSLHSSLSDETKRTPDRNPFEPLQNLSSDLHGEVAMRYSYEEPITNLHPEIHQQRSGEAAEIPYMALCVEVRDGCLHVFMPPLPHLENYLELVAAVEETARKLETPVRLEGYPPPRDSRMSQLLVTPDPGVIEVNIHPSKNWPDLVKNTEILYEEARLCRLGTEKFMLDGRHTGTGGGNHVTLGSEKPEDSPLLRRPELLQSIITYWQHHPALSYLFSGMFIGPTSQAPRVDEGRDEKMYELEIAFSLIPEGEIPQPWLIDRLLRHLLTDLTGNTHRSEFSIDKLYSPDSSTGRLGILEFRGFEMPPHSRMSLMQACLIRTLVAWFWKEPYKKPLVRWGTELHDRFMLPHHIASDMKDIVKDLNDAGYDFEFDWIAPFLEFRFPRYGSIQIEDITLDIHAGIEPWHVLGEESSSTGTARFVDSSVERLQVKLTGLTDSRYVLSCNGRHVPLQKTGRQGEYVAGVRFRAWSPPSALHPTIDVQAPLVFDLIDTWNGRSIGGCVYHVQHPGGRGYEDLPINPVEAESRRTNRFWDHSYTPGTIAEKPRTTRFVEQSTQAPRPMSLPLEETSSEYPYTLDLRTPSAEC